MKNLLLIAFASTALVACQPETIVEGNSPEEAAADAATATAAANVVLPPSIVATKTYRCADSSVIHIDWLSDNLSANFRAEETGPPVQLKAPATGEALVAEGYSLTGTATAASISITRPGMSAQSCKA